MAMLVVASRTMMSSWPSSQAWRAADFDADLGGDPAEDDGPYPTAPELGIEVGAEKRPPGGLGDLEIAGLGQAEREVGKAFSRRLDPHLNHRCRL